MIKCSVVGCERDVRHRGFCGVHYYRWRRYGDPLSGNVEKGKPLKWLKEAIMQQTDNCIVWPFCTNEKGYGQVSYQNKFMIAHRLALMLHEGRTEAPAKMHCAHTPIVCHNPACVNPRHLRWASAAENVADMRLDGTYWQGEQNGSAKLTESQVLAIREDKRIVREIAQDYGVSKHAIYRIKNRESWKHL